LAPLFGLDDRARDLLGKLREPVVVQPECKMDSPPPAERQPDWVLPLLAY